MKFVTINIILLFIFKTFSLLCQNCDTTSFEPVFKDDINATKGYLVEGNSEKATGEYGIWYGCSNPVNKIIKPLIIVEGFDIGNDVSLRKIYKLFNNNCLLDYLSNDGYDIIALNYTDGRDYIQKNAFLLEELIKTVGDELKANGSSHPVVIMAHSMGGLVIRYALSDMETNNINQDVPIRLMITWDSPHGGANMPLGIQYMANFWINNVTILTTELNIALGQFLFLHFLTDRIKSKLFDETIPAAQQMLIEFFRETDKRQIFLGELNNLGVGGYPAKIRKVGIANGSINGTKQIISEGDPIFLLDHCFPFACNDISNSIRIKNNVYAQPGKDDDNDVFEGILRLSIPVNHSDKNGSDIIVDHVPGCTINEIKDLANDITTATSFAIQGKIKLPLFSSFLNPIQTTQEIDLTITLMQAYGTTFCFIPTINALDLKTSDYFINLTNNPNYQFTFKSGLTTSFDRIYGQNLNLDHRVMDNSIVNTLIDEISPPHLYLQHETVTKNITREARKCITIGKSVTENLPEGHYLVKSAVHANYRAGEEINLENGAEAEVGAEIEYFLKPFDCSNPDGICMAKNNQNDADAASYKNYDPALLQNSLAAIINSDTIESETEDIIEENNANTESEMYKLSLTTSLSDPFPNPVKDYTMISYTLDIDKLVTFTIYNMHGKIITRIFENQNQKAGCYIFPFDTKNYSNGIYYYTLQAGNNFYETRKLVVTH